MASSIDKTSVREQFNSIKDDFNKLSASGKVTTEVAVLMEGLITLFEVVLAIFMEKKTKKNSNNSGIPSSQSDPDETSSDTDGNSKKKKRKPKKNDFDNRTETVTVEVIEPKNCKNCDTDLTDTPESSRERRTLIDIVFEKTTAHVDAIEKVCPTCDTVNKPKKSS